jgi:hypothetical protein
MEISVDKKRLYQYIFALSIFTVIYNLLEGIVSTYFGVADETLSLFGFGLDSFIEMISGLGIIQLVIRIRQNPNSPQTDFEKTALRITGWCLYALVGILIFGAILSIIEQHKPQNSLAGVIISSISTGIMYWLIQGKVKIGKFLQSDAIIADANCAKVCMYMSLVLLGASLINYLTGFLYSDVLGAFGIAWFSYQEGKEALEKAAGIHSCECHEH